MRLGGLYTDNDNDTNSDSDIDSDTDNCLGCIGSLVDKPNEPKTTCAQFIFLHSLLKMSDVWK